MKKWRQFERLVASIEQVLLPRGAIVRHPDRVPDVHTGALREVDASIRYKVGSTELLITIECRERTKKDDVVWIEQLAEKQRSIGASKTIAVSASGFTESAHRKARVLGIELRTMKKIKPRDIRSWVQDARLSLFRNQLVVKHATLTVFMLDGDDEKKLAFKTPHGRPAAFHEPAFFKANSGEPVSLLDIFSAEVGDQFQSIHEQQTFEQPREIILERQFDNAVFCADTTLGLRWLARIIVECEVRVDRRVPSLQHVHVYSDMVGDIAQRVRFETELDGHDLSIEMTLTKPR